MSVQTGKVPRNMKHITELMGLLMDEFDQMENRDPLTGAFNRRYFERELARIEQEGVKHVGLLMIDVNGLKSINDLFGKQRGDDILTSIVCILEQVCENSVICRTGDDEFSILFYGTRLKKAEGIATIIRQASKDGVFCSDIPYSVCCGVAYRSGPEISAEALCRLAESSLYNNKLNDRNSVHGRIVQSLRETMRERHLETTEHLGRMERMAATLALRLGLPPDDSDRLTLLGSMHDIGKISIPDGIINKPGKLDEEERSIMNAHSETGYRIATATHELSGIANEILHHHERWDGGGYPNRVAGNQIPLLARVISVIDTYDVMTHRRPYKEPCSHAEALAELEACAGGQFDPDVVSLFFDAFGNVRNVPDDPPLYAGIA